MKALLQEIFKLSPQVGVAMPDKYLLSNPFFGRVFTLGGWTVGLLHLLAVQDMPSITLLSSVP